MCINALEIKYIIKNDMELLDKFLKYISIDTQSSEENSDETPSTKKQFDLLNYLKKEIEDYDFKPVLSKYGYLYLFIPSNNPKIKKSVGFLAHVDTSPDADGKNIKPRIIKNYQGEDIKLSSKWTTTTKNFHELKKVIGDSLVVTNGETLLGADDKAGIAVIMHLIEFYSRNKDYPHGDLYFCFTPDEEIGNGTKYIDLKLFKPEFAFTLDGSDVNCFEFETFNAASAKVTIEGKSVHPGSAKNKMVNAAMIATEFESLLPPKMKPQYTENYEGFNHLTKLSGNVEKAEMNYIIRNHHRESFEKQKIFFKEVERALNRKYHYKAVKVEIHDQYYNMGEVLHSKK
jgi:tripeptide aminopeptidase